MMAASLCLLLALSGLAQADRAAVEADIEKTLATLPGDTSFVFTELRDGKPDVLFGVRADQRMAVGSSFKLFILGTLIEEVNQGRRRQGDTMLLRPDLTGPPHSELADWPIGAPVTLYTLALKMISISDNTATDHLIYLLGRENIERQMALMGHGDPAVNRPLLSTREMTMLRDKKRDLPGKAYQQLDEAGKRKFLADRFTGVPNYNELDFDAGAYKLAEWYASPIDMAQAMAWIQANTAAERPAHLIRAILSIDPKLPHDAKVWPFVGFKGGSEDQLLAGNWLLQNQNGRWYTMHLYYNNPTGPANQELMIGAIGKIFERVQETVR